MLGNHEKIDRRVVEPELEPVDVLMLTLHAAQYLGRCLDSVYREIPVNRLIILDGGSNDKTVEIADKYPRTEIHVRPDIRTTGKGLEFLFSCAKTPWIAMIDADMELAEGWYDEMSGYKSEYDYFESKRIMHYEFWREVPGSVDMQKRSAAIGQLARRDCFAQYHVDDDYMWRATDYLLKQVAEKNGYRFGKVSTTYHYHHTTDTPKYESDEHKRGSRLVFQEPRIEVLHRENWEKRLDDFSRAIVKYIDPEFVFPSAYEGTLRALLHLDAEWIRKTNPRWHEALVEYRRRHRVTRGPRVLRFVRSAVRFALIMAKDAGKRQDFKRLVGRVVEQS